MAHFEAHRMEDRLMSVISHYIKGELRGARQLLGLVRVGVLLRSHQVQRWRLAIITLGLRLLVRLPRIDWVARRMFERWHVKRPPA